MGTAVLHTAFGLLPKIYGEEWSEFSRLRLWKSVSIANDRNMAAFWFVIFGPTLFLAGLAIYEIEMAGIGLPRSFGWTLLGVSAVGSVMCPKSGFTILLLPQAIYYLVSS